MHSARRGAGAGWSARGGAGWRFAGRRGSAAGLWAGGVGAFSWRAWGCARAGLLHRLRCVRGADHGDRFVPFEWFACFVASLPVLDHEAFALQVENAALSGRIRYCLREVFLVSARYVPVVQHQFGTGRCIRETPFGGATSRASSKPFDPLNTRATPGGKNSTPCGTGTGTATFSRFVGALVMLRQRADSQPPLFSSRRMRSSWMRRRRRWRCRISGPGMRGRPRRIRWQRRHKLPRC